MLLSTSRSGRQMGRAVRRMCFSSAAALAADLVEALGSSSKVSRAESEIHAHASLEKGYVGWNAPEVLVYADNEEDVQRTVRLCSRLGVSLVPWGAGTSVEGHLDCPAGGVMLDLSRMNNIISVHTADQDCRVQCGVTREQLNAHLRHTGLMFPVDPGGNATIGGMVSTNASGTTTQRYGSMRANVLGLHAVVSPDGEVVRAGGRARKSSAGLDLTRLFVGAEGTLGVVTEIQLRLHPEPQACAAAVCTFPNLAAAVEAVASVLCVGTPARTELLDAETMRCLDGWRGQRFDVAPTLFLEFHGGPAAVVEQVEAVREIVGDFDGGKFHCATVPEERSALWRARHDAFWAIKDAFPGLSVLATDVAVPLSALAPLVEETRRHMAELGIRAAPLFGHVGQSGCPSPRPVPLFFLVVMRPTSCALLLFLAAAGDGSFHLLPLFDAGNTAELARIRDLEEAMVVRAIELGGTCTGEHGVGTAKRKYLEREFGRPACAAMRAIKTALDPANVMNPGKIVYSANEDAVCVADRLHSL